jgi:hypothetical protein
MKSFWINSLSLAIWLATAGIAIKTPIIFYAVKILNLFAASHRIISVERENDQYLWCIVEGDLNETISWEFEKHYLLEADHLNETQSKNRLNKAEISRTSVKYFQNLKFGQSHGSLI